MPERSFGRTVRYRRTKLGLSQAKLGDLVGRSASTIRSWERDRTTPTESTVLHALAAVLGVDERSLFEKAGQEPPAETETSPTVEEALATLRREPVHPSDEAEEGAETGEGAEQPETRAEEADEEGTPSPEAEDAGDGSGEPVPLDEARRAREPGYVASREPFVVTTPALPVIEHSYMEDPRQRQLYRVRNLATLVAAVALLVALVWALAQGLESLGAWWDDFFGSLRI